MIEGLLLDCDGVLADSEGLNHRCWSEAFRARFGAGLPGGASALVGLDLERIYRLGLEGAGRSAEPLDSATRAELLSHKSRLFLELAPRELRPVLGARELVAAAQARRIPRAVVSSALRPRLLRTLELVALADGWSAVLAGDDLLPGPPPTKDWARAAALIGAPLVRCAIVEDSVEGIMSARDAGVGCVVGVATALDPARLYAAGAHVVYPGPWAIDIDRLPTRGAGDS